MGRECFASAKTDVGLSGLQNEERALGAIDLTREGQNARTVYSTAQLILGFRVEVKVKGNSKVTKFGSVMSTLYREVKEIRKVT